MITSSPSAIGNDVVTYTLRENLSNTARSGTITIAGQTFTVVQNGRGVENCLISINPGSQSFNGSGGSGNIQLTLEGGCAWEARSNVNWITITGAGVGIGSSAVNFVVLPNTSSSARKGTILIEGKVFSVKQKAGS